MLATEVGENDCAGGFLNTLLPWADSHRIGYVAWSWNVASCGGFPSLISDYSGTPTPFGAAYKAYLAGHLGGASLRSASVEWGPAHPGPSRPPFLACLLRAVAVAVPAPSVPHIPPAIHGRRATPPDRM